MDKREAEALFANEMSGVQAPDVIVTNGGIAEKYTPTDMDMQAIQDAQDNPDTEHLNHYVCETCGTEADLTEAEAYSGGWDYPPFIGMWGIVSPRTCPNCLIDTTAYWAIITAQEITERHAATIRRIMGEQIVVPE